jgi:glycosyltransferase A (GT-A) superfamily protein (DUF2064 family)
LTARVLVVAHAPEAEPLRPELAELLGPARYVRLEEILLARALAWAAEVAPGRVHVAVEPDRAEPALRRVVGDVAELFAPSGAGASGRVSRAADRLFAAGDGPLLIVWPELPRWRPAHASGALGDLADGCDVSVGPVFDGGFYLVALARFTPAIFEIPDDTWRHPEAMGRMLAAAHQAGLDAGLLRAERALRRPADVEAELADPLLDEELREVLG